LAVSAIAWSMVQFARIQAMDEHLKSISTRVTSGAGVHVHGLGEMTD
jgi:hypothetical protein